MKSKIYLFLAILILGLSLFLRLYKIENRAPFDWDQNRDYQAIASIASGKLTMIGPVAKGEGGFFLGPLYYYLATPAYLLSGGNPLALPYTSVMIDVIAILTILVIMPRLWGRTKTLSLTLIWACSWFMIESSRISWNVSLIPLWSVMLIYVLSLKTSLTNLRSLFLGLLVGLSWHIHAALIPLSVLVLFFFPRKILKSGQSIFLLILGYLLALLPLIIFDLRHAGLERNLIWQFFTAKAIVTTPWLEVIESVVARLGKNMIAIFTGTSSLNSVWGVFSILIALASLLRHSVIARLAGLMALLNIILVIYLREVGFPEYYLTVASICIIFLLIDWLLSLTRFGRIFTLSFLTIFVVMNLRAYDTQSTAFALAQKIAVVRSIKQLGDDVDLRLELPVGRDSGFESLLRLNRIKIAQSSPLKVIISESVAERMFIDGEITEDLGRFGGLRVSYRVVQ